MTTNDTNEHENVLREGNSVYTYVNSDKGISVCQTNEYYYLPDGKLHGKWSSRKQTQNLNQPFESNVEIIEKKFKWGMQINK